MAKKWYYLGICEPINRGEFLEKLYEVIIAVGKHDINRINSIPDRKDNSYKSYILNMFFEKYIFGTVYVMTEAKASDPIDEKHYRIKNSSHTKPNGIEYIYLLREETDLYTVAEFKDYQNRIVAYRNLTPYLQGTVVIEGTDPRGGYLSKKINDITHFTDYSEDYYKDLKNIDKQFWDEINNRVLEAKGALTEYANLAAREKFKSDRQNDKLKFAKSLYIYCQVLRYIEDVPKIANRFIEMGKYIDGDPVKSMIMCYFNTDQATGRNGKTYRMFGEESYMQANGFKTSNAGLAHDRIADINVFKNHFFYKDEYSFRDTDAEFLKTINKNSNLRISADMLYRGESTVKNDAIFYLAAHNGKINSKLESNERCLTSIRFSDAKYEENICNLTYIYDDIQSLSPLPENLQNTHTAEHIADLYLDIKTTTMTELFDGLLKYSRGITIPKELLAQRLDTSKNSLNLSPELIAILRDYIWTDGAEVEMSFVRIYTKLAKLQYYNNELAKQEVKKLYNFLNTNYSNYIGNKGASNWDNKIITINNGLLNIIETAVGNAVVDTDYNLINQQTLWLYILKMLDIEPNAPVQDPVR